MCMCNHLHTIRHQRKTTPVKTFLSLWSNNVFDRQNVICGVLKQFDMPKDWLLPFEKADCLIWNTMQNTMQLAKSFVLWLLSSIDKMSKLQNDVPLELFAELGLFQHPFSLPFLQAKLHIRSALGANAWLPSFGGKIPLLNLLTLLPIQIL